MIDHANENFDTGSLEDRLARCLGEIIDTPLLTLADEVMGREMELYVRDFVPKLSDRAAGLLVEAGR